MGLKKTISVQQGLKHPQSLFDGFGCSMSSPFTCNKCIQMSPQHACVEQRKGTPLAVVCESSTIDLLGLSYLIGQETHSASASAGRVWQAESRWSH